MDLFRGPVVWFGRQTTHHKAPQLVRDMGSLILSIRPRGALSLGNPRVNDRGVTRVVGYQQCERVSVRMLRCGDIAVFD